MALYCELASLVTESDVEQKFIYPFLKTSAPIGLGLKDAEILTKQVLRRKIIDKGQKQKYYFPDYLITIRGIPILVVEAKSPDEPLTLILSCVIWDSINLSGTATPCWITLTSKSRLCILSTLISTDEVFFSVI